jgi:hypothetical protein
LDARLTTCSGKHFVAKSEKAKDGMSKRRRPAKRTKDLRIGSWNVLLSLYRSKSSQMLLQLHIHYVDITCVQELRWIGTGTIEKKDWITFYGCDTKEHKFGTGLVIHKRLKHLVMSFQPRFPRMCSLRIRKNYSIII